MCTAICCVMSVGLVRRCDKGGTDGQGSIFELVPAVGMDIWGPARLRRGNRRNCAAERFESRDVSGNMYGSAAYGGQYGIRD